MTRFIAPELATLVDDVPTGAGWTFEIKYDGYRIEALIRNGTVRLLTRRGNDWTERFAPVANRLAQFPVRSATFDGEVVALDSSGRSSFQRLQQSLDAGDDAKVICFLFDALEIDGVNLRALPLSERRTKLESVLKKARATTRGAVRLGQKMKGRPVDLFRAACDLGLEGIIAKRLAAPYRSGRTRDWVKVKCGKRQEFIVIGFTPPKNSRIGLGSLLLAVHEGKRLRYAGRVGTGFSDALLRDLRYRLTRLERKASPLAERPAGLPAGVKWVTPKMVVEVSFTEWTEEGLLRHPALEGVREDKPAKDVKRERAT